jgi:hypothetical protein
LDHYDLPPNTYSEAKLKDWHNMTYTLECPIVILSSGQSIPILEVRMYDLSLVQQLLALEAERLKLISGAGLNVGFAGSTEWVLGGAIVLGVLQSVLKSGALKRVEELQAQISMKRSELRACEKFFGYSEVSGIFEALPLAWIATEKVTVREKIKITPHRHSSYMLMSLKVEANQETEREIVKSFVVLPDDFICVQSNIGTIEFRWSQVVAFITKKASKEVSAMHC